jgi:hypothetical protein
VSIRGSKKTSKLQNEPNFHHKLLAIKEKQRKNFQFYDKPNSSDDPTCPLRSATADLASLLQATYGYLRLFTAPLPHPPTAMVPRGGFKSA